MKELPLLPTSFKYFSWENSIGSATETQLQKSYQALTGNGYTKDFSYNVWNDMVELLYKAITQSGLTWDSTFETYKNTKMDFFSKTLTASRFNSVTLNIDKLINYSWKWEILTNELGYVGRPRFYGYTEKKKEADILYGWYLVELVRVINLFIAILKNEADFGEAVCKNIIPMVDYVSAQADTSKPMKPQTMIKSSHLVSGTSSESNPVSVECQSFTKHMVNAVKGMANNLAVIETPKTLNRVKMANSNANNLAHYGILKTKYKVSINSREVSVANPKDEIIKTCDKVTSISAISRPTEMSANINSLHKVTVISAYPSYVQANERTLTKHYVRATNKIPRFLEIKSIANSINKVKSSTGESSNLNVSAISKAIHKVKADVIKPMPSDVKEVIKTIHYVKASVEWAWLYPIKKGTNLYIRQIYSSELQDTELFIDCDDWLNPIQNGSNLYIRQMYDGIKE